MVQFNERGVPSRQLNVQQVQTESCTYYRRATADRENCGDLVAAAVKECTTGTPVWRGMPRPRKFSAAALARRHGGGV